MTESVSLRVFQRSGPGLWWKPSRSRVFHSSSYQAPPHFGSISSFVCYFLPIAPKSYPQAVCAPKSPQNMVNPSADKGGEGAMASEEGGVLGELMLPPTPGKGLMIEIVQTVVTGAEMKVIIKS